LELVRQLGVGDEVRTHSGFFGLIVEAYDDVVVLESEDGTQTKWARQAIAQQVDPVDPEGEASDDLAEGEADDAGLPGVTVSEDTPAEDDPRRDRLWPRRAHHLLRAPPGPRSRGAAARRLPRAAPTVRHPEELRIMPARRIALAALAVLILLLGGGIGAGVSKGGWEPAPKLALDLEGGTQIILQAQSRDGSAIDSAAMEQARQIMSQRINAMGVAETEITVQGGTNIVIDVPGQLDQATSQAIRQTAAMSFRPVLAMIAPEGAEEAQPSDGGGEASDGGGEAAEPSDAGGGADEETSEEPADPSQHVFDGLVGEDPDSAPSAAPAEGELPYPAWAMDWLTPEIESELMSADCVDPAAQQEKVADAAADEPVVACDPDGSVKYLLGP